MTHLPDEEMIWLNALADDELSAADKAIWLKRIDEDTDAKAAYECILALKANLKNYTVQPKTNAIITSQHSPTSNQLWKIAASFLVVFALSGIAFFFIHQNSSLPIQVADKEILKKDKTPFEWHSKFSKTHYDFTNITPKQQKLALSNTELLLPDLRASGLALVSAKLLKTKAKTSTHKVHTQLLHYVGSSGCRLTLHLGPTLSLKDDIKKLSLETNFKNWTVNDTQIWVLASGMDKTRFASITAYLQEYTTAASKKIYLSNLEDKMGDVYKTARSCG
ncbi:MAG: hypothetical protein JJ964_06005 [Rhizobiales bacterium]|nr:hypothetical protein [Hyphomicrobiales bacterium]